jgi:dihydropyrimidinase
VHGHRFSPNRFVQLVATAPAKLFGLFPRKGTIAIGSDADLVLFDPDAEHVISAKTHHMRVDYSMFEGIKVKGMPKTVLSRGRAVIENGKFVGKAGSGEFVRRQTYAGV